VKLSDAFDSLGNRRVILFGGKGGVGKTTIASAAALHYTKTRKVTLFTTDPASNLRDVFGNRQPGTGNLVIEELDATALYARFLKANVANLIEIGDRGTYLDRDELQRFFELSLPGVDEIMAWMRIGELAEENPDATIVVDTAPTGHALRMLAAGDHFRQFALALDAMEEKHRNMVRQLTRRDVRDEIDTFIERFESDASRRRALLTDPARSAFVPVFLSEPWVVEQTLRLIDEVRTNGFDIPHAILNRAIGEPDCKRCRERAKRDKTASARLAPLQIVEAPRACVPLDSVEALRAWMR
jgi:arsenite-transporting ATPase